MDKFKVGILGATEWLDSVLSRYWRTIRGSA